MNQVLLLFRSMVVVATSAPLFFCITHTTSKLTQAVMKYVEITMIDAAAAVDDVEPVCDATVNASSFFEDEDEEEDSSDDDEEEEYITIYEEDKGTISEQEDFHLTEEDLESFGFDNLWSHLECKKHARDANKPLFTPEMWARMRNTYSKLAGFDMGPYNPNPNYYSDFAEDGKGRGAFASIDFKKGELVHDGALSTVFWEDGLDWKRYAMSLPRSMACDVLEWTWIQEVYDEGWLLCMNLNEAAFMNDGGEDSNVAPKDEKSLKLYAVRGKSAPINCCLQLRVNHFVCVHLINTSSFLFRHKKR
jgi:hypothetical protein